MVPEAALNLDLYNWVRLSMVPETALNLDLYNWVRFSMVPETALNLDLYTGQGFQWSQKHLIECHLKKTFLSGSIA